MEQARPLKKFRHTDLQLTPNMESVLLQIIKGGKLAPEDLTQLTDRQKEEVKNVFFSGLATLADDDRERFIENIEDTLTDETNEEIFERNHTVIMGAISWLTQSEGKFPSNTQIAKETGLSRPTVIKHLKTYYSSEAYKQKAGQYQVLREKLLAKIYSFANNGNMRAAKIFIDATAPQERPKISNQQNNTQNNFIQINGLTITEAQLKSLPQEQQAKIYEVLETLKPQDNE